MKFSCTKEELSNALQTAKHAVSTRSTRKALEGILFDIRGDDLVLNATDMNVGIKTQVKVNPQEKGAVIIDSNLISNIVSRLEGDTIQFGTDERNKVHIESGASTFNLNGLDAVEFPDFPDDNKKKTYTIEARELKRMIDATRFAVANNDSIPVITGIKLENSADGFRLVACDGFRLAIRSKENDSEVDELSVVLPGSAASELSSILTGLNGEVTITLSDSQIFFNFGPTTFTARLIDGSYIDYNGIFPDEYLTEFRVDRNELLKACEQVAVIANKGNNNLIKMDIDEGALKISSNSTDADGLVKVDIEKTGDDITIAFNSKYFIDALKAIGEDTIDLKFSTPVGPVEITPLDGNHFSYLILPVRLARS